MAAAIIKQSGDKEVPILQSILQHHTLPVTPIKPGTFNIHNVNIQWQCDFIASLWRAIIYRKRWTEWPVNPIMWQAMASLYSCDKLHDIYLLTLCYDCQQDNRGRKVNCQALFYKLLYVVNPPIVQMVKELTIHTSDVECCQTFPMVWILV